MVNHWSEVLIMYWAQNDKPLFNYNVKKRCTQSEVHVSENWGVLLHVSPSLTSEGDQGVASADTSLETTGISCQTLALGFRPTPLEVTFKRTRENTKHEIHPFVQ